MGKVEDFERNLRENWQAPGSFDTQAMAAGQRIYTSPTGSYTQRDVGEAGSSSGGWSHHESDEDAGTRRKAAAKQAQERLGAAYSPKAKRPANHHGEHTQTTQASLWENARRDSQR